MYWMYYTRLTKNDFFLIFATTKNLYFFNYFQRRDKKSAYETPKPFVVTAGLHIAEQENTQVRQGHTMAGEYAGETGVIPWQENT